MTPDKLVGGWRGDLADFSQEWEVVNPKHIYPVFFSSNFILVKSEGRGLYFTLFQEKLPEKKLLFLADFIKN